LLFPVIQKGTIETLNVITPLVLGLISYMIGGGLRTDALRKLGKAIARITGINRNQYSALAIACILSVILWTTQTRIINISPEISAAGWMLQYTLLAISCWCWLIISIDRV
jgi:hypothetical protein